MIGPSQRSNAPVPSPSSVRGPGSLADLHTASVVPATFADDPPSLAALIEANRERLLRTIRARLHPSLLRRVEPEDVLQDAWLAAAARLGSRASAPYSTPFLWLRAVVIQTVVDVQRHHLGAGMRDLRREAASPDTSQTAAQAAFIAGTTSPSGAAQRQERATAVQAALARLAPTDREIIALRHDEDLANDEVAAVLAITGKAASIRYVRALTRLRAALADEVSHG